VVALGVAAGSGSDHDDLRCRPSADADGGCPAQR
jgi:hypothetical protein